MQHVRNQRKGSENFIPQFRRGFFICDDGNYRLQLFENYHENSEMSTVHQLQTYHRNQRVLASSPLHQREG